MDVMKTLVPQFPLKMMCTKEHFVVRKEPREESLDSSNAGRCSRGHYFQRPDASDVL